MRRRLGSTSDRTEAREPPRPADAGDDVEAELHRLTEDNLRLAEENRQLRNAARQEIRTRRRLLREGDAAAGEVVIGFLHRVNGALRAAMELADAAYALRMELGELYDVFAEAAEGLDPETRSTLHGGTDIELARVVSLHAQWLLQEVTASDGQPLWEEHALALSRRFAWRAPLPDSFRYLPNDWLDG
jgi:hypothetical protein